MMWHTGINGLMRRFALREYREQSRRLLSFTRFRTPANAGARRPRRRTQFLQLGELTLSYTSYPTKG
ncbi:hypothetical protein M8494_25480 [Serratia ureilytica]